VRKKYFSIKAEVFKHEQGCFLNYLVINMIASMEDKEVIEEL